MGQRHLENQCNFNVSLRWSSLIYNISCGDDFN